MLPFKPSRNLFILSSKVPDKKFSPPKVKATMTDTHPLFRKVEKRKLK